MFCDLRNFSNIVATVHLAGSCSNGLVFFSCNAKVNLSVAIENGEFYTKKIKLPQKFP